MKREREKHITRLHIILFFLVIIICISIYAGINIGQRKSITKYRNFENEIINASMLYVKINQINLKDGYEKKITINKLYDQGLLQNELVNKCKGYAIVSSDKNIATYEYEITYSAYISCKNKYTTQNYSEY